MKFLTIALLCLLVGCGGNESDSPPNIVMIIVDDLGRQDVGVYGSSLYETPNIDAVAASGLRFDNAYTAHPRCVPSRVAMLSGQYPANFGVPGFEDRTLGPHALPLEATTFAETLRASGYRTGYVGKWHLGKEGGEPQYQGFDVSILAGKAGAPPSYFYPYETSRSGEFKDFVEYAGGVDGEYLTDRLTDEALHFVSQEKDDPFLLVLAHYAVHTPIEAPEELTAKYRQKLGRPDDTGRDESDIVVDGNAETKTRQNNPTYAAMVENVDDNIGRLMAALVDAGLDENTVVIITSDHGGLSSRGIGNRRELATSNLPYRQGKGWLYDGGIRVPMIVRWPHGIKPGQVTDRQITGTDHYPTILQLAGLPLDNAAHSDGVSYRAAFDGSAGVREPMYWHSSLGRPGQTGDSRSSAIIDGEWKLIQWYSLENEDIVRVELFNLERDPEERNDLYDTEKAQRERLAALLDEWKLSVNARLGEFKGGK